MSVDPTVGAPAAPEAASEDTVAPADSAAAPTPVAAPAPAAAPAGIDQTERNRRAAEGRQRVEYDRKLAAANAQIAQLGQAVAQLTTQITAAEQRRQTAELAELAERDPLAAANRRIEMLEQRIAGAQPQPTQPTTPVQPAVDPDVAYTQEMARQIISRVNAELGTELTGDEADLDWDSPKTFELSARLLASRSQGAVTSTKPPAAVATGGDVPKAEKQADSAEDIAQRVSDIVRRDLGISSPAGPQPLSPRAASGAPTEEDLQATVQDYSSKSGPRPTIQKLREQREAIARTVPRTGR